MKRVNIYILLVVTLLATSCSEYTKLQKSKDNDLKFLKAKEYYEKKKYMQAATLFESVLPFFRGGEKGEESLYLLAMSYLKNRDYLTAKNYFSSYSRNYPKSKYAEDCKFYTGYCYYKDSPNVKLDQSATKKGIEEFSMFIELYPESAYITEVLNMVNELQEKLAYKAFLNASLYYKMGNYMGNNYLAAIITATNAIKEFPSNKYEEEFAFIILKSKFQQAEKSVREKMEDRYRDTVDEYYNFINDFPKSKYKKDAQQIFEKSQKFLN